MAPMKLGFVVGLDQEALLVSRWGTAAIGGGTYDGALRAAEVLVGQGVTALISYGVAGGLDPDLAPGTLLAASEVMTDGTVIKANLMPAGVRQVRMLGARDVVGTVADKAALWTSTAAACVDLESGAVALTARQHRLPFGALRAICDPAQRTLPPAAMTALEDGAIQFRRVVWSLLRRPWQLGGLLRLGNDARVARNALQAVHFDLIP